MKLYTRLFCYEMCVLRSTIYSLIFFFPLDSANYAMALKYRSLTHRNIVMTRSEEWIFLFITFFYHVGRNMSYLFLSFYVAKETEWCVISFSLDAATYWLSGITHSTTKQNCDAFPYYWAIDTAADRKGHFDEEISSSFFVLKETGCDCRLFEKSIQFGTDRTA